MRWLFIFFALVLPDTQILTAMAAENGIPVTLDKADDLAADDAALAAEYLRAGDELLEDNQLERADVWLSISQQSDASIRRSRRYAAFYANNPRILIPESI